MFNNFVPYFIKLALEQVLVEEERLIKLQKKSEYLPLISDLIKLSVEMQKWLLGKNPLKDPIKSFKMIAKKIEVKADKISEKLWIPNMLNIVSVFEYAEQEKARAAKTFEYQLKVNFDLQRQRLLEQVRGARLLKNNNDLGEEVEKVFLEYLNKNLDSDVLAVRGGHIFDIDNNQSKQMDIIIIPSKILSMCPSDTSTGKYNVLIDNVVAGISVKSTLDKKRFREAWKDIQSIPEYKEKDDVYPRLKDKHTWPLCFIFGANSERMDILNREWDALTKENQKYPLQLFMTLDNGYSIAGDASWPLRFLDKKNEYSGSYHSSHELSHGLGLALMLLSINARAAFLSNKPLKTFDKYFDLILKSGLQAGCGSPTYTRKYNNSGKHLRELKNGIYTAQYSKYLHNNLEVFAININNKTLTNNARPLPSKRRYYLKILFEPRWFDINSLLINENSKTCTLTEWIKTSNSCEYHSRIVTLDYDTGEDIEFKDNPEK